MANRDKRNRDFQENRTKFGEFSKKLDRKREKVSRFSKTDKKNWLENDTYDLIK